MYIDVITPLTGAIGLMRRERLSEIFCAWYADPSMRIQLFG